MDVKLINPFLSAGMNVLQSMFGISASSGAPYILEGASTHRWEISGILGVTGDYDGLVAIRLHRLLADRMLVETGVKVHSERERHETVFGMIGELTNIISGNAAAELPHNLEISPPAVVSGENHEITWPRGIPVIGIPFFALDGPFEIDVCLRKKVTVLVRS